MPDSPKYPPEFAAAFAVRFGQDGKIEEKIPPVFREMEGRILGYDAEARTLTAQFPTRPRFHNPYGTMQGGIIAAAIDNTIGPLSTLNAPPNLTRDLSVKYKKPVTDDLGYIIVIARLERIEPPFVFFSARVESPDGLLMARASARHYILPEQA